MLINLKQQDGIVNVLANPRIRVKNREKAKILIGDKVPVVTTTATANVGVASSVSYLDVGLKLDVESTVSLQDEVIDEGQPRSQHDRQGGATPNGGLAYQVGTRTASTTLALRDGETQVLAGLINDEERATLSRFRDWLICRGWESCLRTITHPQQDRNCAADHAAHCAQYFSAGKIGQ